MCIDGNVVSRVIPGYACKKLLEINCGPGHTLGSFLLLFVFFFFFVFFCVCVCVCFSFSVSISIHLCTEH